MAKCDKCTNVKCSNHSSNALPKPAVLKETEENVELFKLSEGYFYKYFANKEVDKATRDKMLNEAIRLCTKAASLGHPGAIYKLGFYYDKDDFIKTSTESERCRKAMQLYSMVFRSRDDFGMAHTEADKLKQLAAYAFMLMVINIDSSERVAYDEVVDEIAANADFYQINNELIKRAKETTSSMNEIDKMLSVLDIKEDDKRPPLFGVFKVTERMLKSAFNTAKLDDARSYAKKAAEGARGKSAKNDSDVNKLVDEALKTIDALDERDLTVKTLTKRLLELYIRYEVGKLLTAKDDVEPEEKLKTLEEQITFEAPIIDISCRISELWAIKSNNMWVSYIHFKRSNVDTVLDYYKSYIKQEDIYARIKAALDESQKSGDREFALFFIADGIEGNAYKKRRRAKLKNQWQTKQYIGLNGIAIRAMQRPYIFYDDDVCYAGAKHKPAGGNFSKHIEKMLKS